MWLPCKHRLALARRQARDGDSLYTLQNYAGGPIYTLHLPISSVCHDCMIEESQEKIIDFARSASAKKY